MRAARVHHAARRRGGAWPLAARAQQAERMRRIGVLMPLAADDPEAQTRIAASCRGCSNWAGPIGRNVRIDYRWAAGDADRIRKICGGIGRARAGRHPGLLAPHAVGPLLAGDPHRADRVRAASPIRSAPASSTAWRGRAATPPVSSFRIRHGGEMAGTAQADRAGRDASGGHSGSRRIVRDRPVRRDPGRGAVARGGGEPDQRARRRRDRARHHGLRALTEWRADRDGERVGGGSSRI